MHNFATFFLILLTQAEMHPRLSKKDKLRTENPPAYAPVPEQRHPNQLTRNPVVLSERPLVFLPGGVTLTQNLVPPLPGQVGFNGDRPQDGSARPPPLPDGHTSFVPRDDEPLLTTIIHDSSLVNDRHRRKKQAQWARWKDVVIPQLVQPFQEVFHLSQSFKTLDELVLPSPPCTCGEDKRKLTLVAVRFLRMCHFIFVPGRH